MKNLIILIATFYIFTSNIFAQDMFPARRFTHEPAQEGFATWSPDGKYIVYQYSDMYDTIGKNGLWRKAEDKGGATQIFKGLAEHPKWSPDGRYIVFDADTGNSIKMIPAEGGDPISFLPDTIEIENGGLPCWSPDGTQIAFLERKHTSLCIYNMKSGELRSVFSKEGHLPFPGCWSEDGKSVLIGLMEMESRKSSIWKIDVDGKGKEQITGHRENFYRYLALSPDGSLLIYATYENRAIGLYIMPVEGGVSLPLSITPQNHNEGASWSPDGKKIAFTSTRAENFDIWIMEMDIDLVKRNLQMQ